MLLSHITSRKGIHSTFKIFQCRETRNKSCALRSRSNDVLVGNFYENNLRSGCNEKVSFGLLQSRELWIWAYTFVTDDTCMHQSVTLGGGRKFHDIHIDRWQQWPETYPCTLTQYNGQRRHIYILQYSQSMHIS